MKLRKLLAGIISAVMVFGTLAMPVFADENANVAKIGETEYATLKEAVAAAQNGETITLLSDASGDGIEIGSNKNITIDFDGFTYTVTGNLVGDTNPPTNAFRFLKDSTVTLKNGTINLGSGTNTMILVQNYANLTIENMTLDFKKNRWGYQGYTLSCNGGNTVITGNTNIISPIGSTSNKKLYAINVYNEAPHYTSATITIDDGMTGKITGNLEISGTTVNEGTQKLIIKNGTYTGIINDVRDDKAIDVIDIYGGTFENKKSNAQKYVEEGYIYNPGNGTVSTLEDSISKNATVSFTRKSDSEYYIYIDTVGGKLINGLMSADLTFALTVNSQDDLSYTIKPADDIKIIEVSENRFEFNYNGTDASSSGMGNKFKIGTVVFEGYCQDASFEAVEADTNIVNTTKLVDSIVDSYIPNGDGVNNGKFEISAKSKISVKITQPTSRLKVNVAFPNSVTENTSAYQDMTVTVSGAGLTEPIVKALGSDANKMKDGAYKVSVSLPKNNTYTVTVSGAGYRTARYTVTMKGSKTLNFWNNAKDADTVVEEGNAASARKVTFLAGDIVRDNSINIYDLSAVVSYFGTKVNKDTQAEYAKYDLNRDGIIDSKDVAYVLVSWGK